MRASGVAALTTRVPAIERRRFEIALRFATRECLHQTDESCRSERLRDRRAQIAANVGSRAARRRRESESCRRRSRARAARMSPRGRLARARRRRARRPPNARRRWQPRNEKFSGNTTSCAPCSAADAIRRPASAKFCRTSRAARHLNRCCLHLSASLTRGDFGGLAERTVRRQLGADLALLESAPGTAARPSAPANCR